MNQVGPVRKKQGAKEKPLSGPGSACQCLPGKSKALESWFSGGVSFAASHECPQLGAGAEAEAGTQLLAGSQSSPFCIRPCPWKVMCCLSAAPWPRSAHAVSHQWSALQHLVGSLHPTTSVPWLLTDTRRCLRAGCTQHIPHAGFKVPWKMGPGRRLHWRLLSRSVWLRFQNGFCFRDRWLGQNLLWFGLSGLTVQGRGSALELSLLHDQCSMSLVFRMVPTV